MSLSPSKIYFYNLLMLIIPETSFFGFKCLLLKWCGAKIENSVRVCSSARFFGSAELEIGRDTWVGHQCLIIATTKISIGSYVDIGPKVYIGTGSHIIDPDGQRSAGVGDSKPIIIKNGCWLGAGCLILPGVSINEKVIVAAGAVVSKNVPAFLIVGGVPAKIIKVL